jgi:hypothetical protein
MPNAQQAAMSGKATFILQYSQQIFAPNVQSRQRASHAPATHAFQLI